MRVLSAVLVVLSCLLLGAHFLRFGALAMVGLCLLLPFLLFIRRSWSVRFLQVALVLGGLEWIRTAVALVGERKLAGEPWVRMAVILGAVSAVTFLSAAALQLGPLRGDSRGRAGSAGGTSGQDAS